ncbi:hypothetical protein [Aquimarina muelleri]|nr:hypothetical protein [Aquimarina muelleri]MCX2764255.1 hypothetical protein [Aquimarina muelleri]
MKTEYIILKEASLNNNCPECYSTQDMVLSFKQKKMKSKFLVTTKSNLIESIYCNKCENQIFPGQWTTDIERVYDYHKKTISQPSGKIRFTWFFYSILFLILLVAAGAYIYLYHPNIIGISDLN